MENCDDCLYKDVHISDEPCGPCDAWSNWKPKEEKVMKSCKNCSFMEIAKHGFPCGDCNNFSEWRTRQPSYDIKTLLLFHLIEHHPDATPAGCCKTLKEGLKKVTLNGKKQWVLWFNTPDGSTHILSEDGIKEEE
jgi:hypothetical protein